MFGFGPELIVLYVLLPIVLFCMAIVDLTKRTFADGSTKVIWALVILFIPVLGPFLYLFIGKKQGHRRAPATARLSGSHR